MKNSNSLQQLTDGEMWRYITHVHYSSLASEYRWTINQPGIGHESKSSVQRLSPGIAGCRVKPLAAAGVLETFGWDFAEHQNCW